MGQDFRSTYASSRSRRSHSSVSSSTLLARIWSAASLRCSLLGVVVLAAAQQLHDVPAVLGVERLGNLIDLQPHRPLWRNSGGKVSAVFQSRSPPSAAEPVSCELTCATAPKSSPARMRLRRFSSFCLTVASSCSSLVRIRIWRVWTCSPRSLLLQIAHLIQAHDVKAGGRADRRADFPGLQAQHRVGQHGRQLGALAPAQLAAVQRRLRVGVGDGELGEVLAILGALVNVLGLLLGRFQLRGRWPPGARRSGYARHCIRHWLRGDASGGPGIGRFRAAVTEMRCTTSRCWSRRSVSSRRMESR